MTYQHTINDPNTSDSLGSYFVLVRNQQKQVSIKPEMDVTTERATMSLAVRDDANAVYKLRHDMRNQLPSAGFS